jgi:hypothetical protein
MLASILSMGLPSLKLVLALLPTLRALRILKDDKEQAMWEARYKEAIRRAESSSMDPVAARKQYDNADKAVDAAWDKEFGQKP